MSRLTMLGPRRDSSSGWCVRCARDSLVRVPRVSLTSVKKALSHGCAAEKMTNLRV